jgi:hypothetical protein
MRTKRRRRAGENTRVFRSDVLACSRDQTEPRGRIRLCTKPEILNQAISELEISTTFESFVALGNAPPQAADKPHSSRKMAKIPTMNPLMIAWGALVLSISLNLSAIYLFRRRPDVCERVPTVDDSHFSK